MTRDSPDHKPETGSESCSGKHNPLVRGSTPRGPTTAELPWPRPKALPSMRGIPFPVPIAWPGRHVVRKLGASQIQRSIKSTGDPKPRQVEGERPGFDSDGIWVCSRLRLVQAGANARTSCNVSVVTTDVDRSVPSLS